MAKNDDNIEFLVKYCKIMVNKLQKSEDSERMEKWLETITSEKCDEALSLMYLELMLWALHTNRINVFPFKYLPPVDHGEITDAYEFALEIVKLEPKRNDDEKCGEVKIVVTDDLKEYFAFQEVCDFGSQCYYSFSDKAPISNWKMPSNLNLQNQNNLTKDPNYWMTIFSRPSSSKKQNIRNEDQQNQDCDEDEEAAEEKSGEPSEKTICPDLSRVEYILNNLSFGGKKPQDIRTLVDNEDTECNGRKISIDQLSDEQADEPEESNPEISIDAFVLSIDCNKNKFENPSNSKKLNKTRKNANSKKDRLRQPNNCSEVNHLNHHEAFPKKNINKRLWEGLDLNEESWPEDSVLALCSNSFSADNHKPRRKQNVNHPKQHGPVKSKKWNNSEFIPSNSSPGSSKSCRNREVPQTYRFRPDRVNFKLERDKCNIKEMFPLSEDISDDGSTNLMQTRDITFKNPATNCYENYDVDITRERNYSGNQLSTSKGKKNQRCVNDQDAYLRDIYSDTVNQVLFRDDNFAPGRSQRRLQFSDVHAEPQAHKPRLSAEPPLKPCLRKFSDETPIPETIPNYCDQYHKNRDVKRDPQFCYFSKPPSKLNMKPKANTSSGRKSRTSP